MQKTTARLLLLPALLAVIGLGSVAHGALLPGHWVATRTITDSQAGNGNGSFESGTFGWSASSGASLSTGTADPPGATQGNRYLVISETGVPRVASRADNRRRSIGLVGSSQGEVLRVLFDYYVPSLNGYNQLVVQLLTMDGNSALSVSTINVNPTSASDTWLTFAHDFLVTDQTFDGVDLRIDFRRNGGDAATYSGFVDNASIEQGYLVPEPSTLALLGLGLGAALCVWRKRTR